MDLYDETQVLIVLLLIVLLIKKGIKEEAHIKWDC